MVVQANTGEAEARGQRSGAILNYIVRELASNKQMKKQNKTKRDQEMT